VYRHVKPFADALKSTDYLDEIPAILNRSTGAHIMRDLHNKQGKDFPDMIRATQDLFFK
jgi:hypothetical protein